MPARVAIVTDAVSQDFIFPIWHRYYAALFGASNIFVVTYAGLSPLFREFTLGGVIELPIGYDDAIRPVVIGRFVASLLPCYDAVIRVDADEFLVVDPRCTTSLAAFIDSMDSPYMTARGFDVIQLPDEPPLPHPPDAPILRHRGFAYPNTALNKTCIVRTPVVWSPGFHWASVHPRLGPLFMLHMKRLDIGWQVGWFGRMLDNIKDNPNVDRIFKDYYDPDEEKIRDYHNGVSNRPRVFGIESWYRVGFTRSFLNNIRFVASDGLYYGEYGHEDVLCEIPPDWKLLL